MRSAIVDGKFFFIERYLPASTPSGTCVPLTKMSLAHAFVSCLLNCIVFPSCLLVHYNDVIVVRCIIFSRWVKKAYCIISTRYIWVDHVGLWLENPIYLTGSDLTSAQLFALYRAPLEITNWRSKCRGLGPLIKRIGRRARN